MTDLIFPGHKSRKNAKSVKIKSAVRKTEKHDRSADRQMTDLIFRDTLLEWSYWVRCDLLFAICDVWPSLPTQTR